MTSGSAPKDSIARCDNGQGAATMSQEARNSRGRAPWRGRTRRPGRQPSRPRRRLAARREPLKEGTMAPRRVWARRRAPAAGAEGARTHRSPGGEGRPAPPAGRLRGTSQLWNQTTTWLQARRAAVTDQGCSECPWLGANRLVPFRRCPPPPPPSYSLLEFACPVPSLCSAILSPAYRSKYRKGEDMIRAVRRPPSG